MDKKDTVKRRELSVGADYLNAQDVNMTASVMITSC